MTSDRPRSLTSFTSFSKGASVTVALVGVLVLVGWMFDIPTLKSILPIWVTMKANTAMAFLLIGISLWLLQEQTRTQMRRVAQGCACAVSLIGLLTLSEYLFGWNLGIDQLLFREPVTAIATSNPGRMAPNTALNFLMIGLALLLLDVEPRRGVRPAPFLTLAAGFVAVLALLGYVYGVTALYGFLAYTKMAVHTAVTFFVACVGILLARPDRGLMAIVTSEDSGGLLARRLLPTAFLVPAILGWLRLVGQRAGLYGTEFGLSLTVIGNILIFVILLFVTSRSLHQMDAARKQAEEERTRIFTTSLDLLCVASVGGYFKQLNPRWETTLGFTIQELLASPFIEFVHPDDRERTQAEVQRLTEGLVTLSFENRYRCKDGSYRWFLWNAVPDAEGRLVYAAARDVTERRQMEEQLQLRAGQLETANKELEAFSYSVSHDLRAPLRAIDGFSLILLEDYADTLDAEGQRLLGVVRDNTQKMSQLIDDLLAFSRIGRAQIAASTIHMRALVQELLEELKPTLGERAVHFEVKPLPEVRGDRAMIRQVVVNLLANAVKFTRPRPRAEIEVGARVDNGQAIYYVKDNGAGFDMQYANKLFGVFQRLHRQEEFEGTGVGLAIVQRVVHRHGGRVWAEGKVNEGATFYFSLPTVEGRHG